MGGSGYGGRFYLSNLILYTFYLKILFIVFHTLEKDNFKTVNYCKMGKKKSFSY